MKKALLLKLADFLEKLPRKRFNYGSWVGSDWKGKEDLSCGTTACALGWATVMPAGRKAGLRLVKNDLDGHQVKLLRKNGGNVATNLDSVLVGAMVFYITREESEYLFLPRGAYVESSRYEKRNLSKPLNTATAKRVAKHIRKFVARGGMP